MKLGFSYKFLFYLLLIVILAYISLEYFNVIEGNKGRSPRQRKYDRQMRRTDSATAIYNPYITSKFKVRGDTWIVPN
jgi:hypothetical protein